MSEASYSDQEIITNIDNYISIENPTLKYTALGERAYISSVGFLKNISDDRLQHIVIEVQYYNSDNALIDSEIKNHYSMSIPPGKEVSFSIKGLANGTREEYASQIINILSVDKAYSPSQRRSPKRKKSVWLEVIISWVPMCLLILAWFYISRNKKFPTAKSVEYMAANNKLMIKHNEYFERLVKAVENRELSKGSEKK